jgi:hypothetical protein
MVIDCNRRSFMLILQIKRDSVPVSVDWRTIQAIASTRTDVVLVSSLLHTTLHHSPPRSRSIASVHINYITPVQKHSLPNEKKQ